MSVTRALIEGEIFFSSYKIMSKIGMRFFTKKLFSKVYFSKNVKFFHFPSIGRDCEKIHIKSTKIFLVRLWFLPFLKIYCKVPPILVKQNLLSGRFFLGGDTSY